MFNKPHLDGCVKPIGIFCVSNPDLIHPTCKLVKKKKVGVLFIDFLGYAGHRHKRQYRAAAAATIVCW